MEGQLSEQTSNMTAAETNQSRVRNLEIGKGERGKKEIWKGKWEGGRGQKERLEFVKRNLRDERREKNLQQEWRKQKGKKTTKCWIGKKCGTIGTRLVLLLLFLLSLLLLLLLLLSLVLFLLLPLWSLLLLFVVVAVIGIVAVAAIVVVGRRGTPAQQ